ncbi:hypothetical protein [Arenivirga flava]|uniref:Uncharacterized protein n=1 Tax=Arenivirga flava TaxID=1930060 RepID=A0AA37ULX1_9MICO|nr:hypothetical protein [Arenivirga flava]GMA28857.1 hypothetical protein GCM10025874_21100 [Arenivirga flava]
MTTMEHGEVAGDHLRAELRPKRFAAARFALDAALGGSFSVTVYDLVVSRLDTGAEVIRTPADVGNPHHLLGQVELDLERKTVAAFLEEWRPA